MLKHIGRPSPALAISVIALFVALGGTSYAVATGSIDSREIKNGTVRSKDLKNNDVRSGDVRNGTLLSKDFRAGQLPEGPRGPTGPRGLQGAPGAAGAAGTPGISGLQLVEEVSPDNSQSGKDAVATCPGTKQIIGTGAELQDENSGTFPDQLQDVVISDIEVFDNLKSVEVRAQEVDATAASWTVIAQAICANVQ